MQPAQAVTFSVVLGHRMLLCAVMLHVQLARGTEGTDAGPEDQAVAAAVGHAASTQLLQPGTPSAAAAAHQQSHLTQAIARSSSNLSSGVLATGSPNKGQSLPKLRTLRSSSESGQSRSPAQLLATSAAGNGLRHGSFEARREQAQQDGMPLLSSTQDGKQWQQHPGVPGTKELAVLADGVSGARGVVAGLSDASAQVDNPDQRITADVSNYVQTSVGLVLLLVRKTLNCAAFAGEPPACAWP